MATQKLERLETLCIRKGKIPIAWKEEYLIRNRGLRLRKRTNNNIGEDVKDWTAGKQSTIPKYLGRL